MSFFKKHWYIIIMGILTLVMIILVVVDQILYKAPQEEEDQTNCQKVNPPPITSIRINSSQDECSGGNCCQSNSGFYSIPIDSQDGKSYWYINQASQSSPYNQLCYQTTDSYCDQTTVVTDVNVVDMATSPTSDVYKDYSTRCCDSANDPNCYTAPIVSVNLPNADSGDSGLLFNDNANAGKMGICVRKQNMGDLRKSKGKYIAPSGLKLGYSDNPSATPESICGDGWTPAGDNIYKGLGTKMYLCKKFTIA